ncbi:MULTISPECIES: O-methyltransferase [Jannaschia]|nr:MULTISPECIES: O-methyltransferase [unclassified Jannaschia]
MSSFRKINYSLRPAKHAERKMMGELFRRLAAFAPLEEYRYVGLGSVWFADFSLYHKSLGIADMVSIERATGSKARFEANRPFNIQMKFKPTTQALPELDWNKRSIVWLDYDGVLSVDVLLDARLVGSSCRSGSIIAISVNAGRADEVTAFEDDRNGPTALERFKVTFGRERVADKIADDDLLGKRFAKLSRSMILSEIEEAVARRNGQGGPKCFFNPIVSFSYKDDAPMTTIVGVLYDEPERENFERCHFGELDFLKDGNELVDIEVPKLTIKEIRYLETQLPLAAGHDLQIEGDIPQREANSFVKLYRYLPNFATLEV